jgi:hypothetical protein
MRHYELYSWSAQYRQERLAEPRKPRGFGSALRNALSSLLAFSKSKGRGAGEPVK